MLLRIYVRLRPSLLAKSMMLQVRTRKNHVSAKIATTCKDVSKTKSSHSHRQTYVEEDIAAENA